MDATDISAMCFAVCVCCYIEMMVAVVVVVLLLPQQQQQYFSNFRCWNGNCETFGDANKRFRWQYSKVCALARSVYPVLSLTLAACDFVALVKSVICERIATSIVTHHINGVKKTTHAKRTAAAVKKK